MDCQACFSDIYYIYYNMQVVIYYSINLSFIKWFNIGKSTWFYIRKTKQRLILCYGLMPNHFIYIKLSLLKDHSKYFLFFYPSTITLFSATTFHFNSKTFHFAVTCNFISKQKGTKMWNFLWGKEPSRNVKGLMLTRDP